MEKEQTVKFALVNKTIRSWNFFIVGTISVIQSPGSTPYNVESKWMVKPHQNDGYSMTVRIVCLIINS